MTTTSAISQPLPPPDLGAGSLGFAIKVSSVDEKHQSTPINAQPLNGFHTRPGNCRTQDNSVQQSLVGLYFPRKINRQRVETSLAGLFRQK
jgi:hypothetical protein